MGPAFAIIKQIAKHAYEGIEIAYGKEQKKKKYRGKCKIISTK